MRNLRTIIFAVVLALALAPALTVPAHAGIMEADFAPPPPPPAASTSSTTNSTGSTDNSSDASFTETLLIILQSLVPRL